ncbi:MAG: sensor histidine kinase [Verrucomicrobiota bacterium]
MNHRAGPPTHEAKRIGLLDSSTTIEVCAMISFRFRLCILLTFSVCTSLLGAPLKSIKDIRDLSAEKASQGLRVELETQVVWVDPIRKAFFAYDGEHGIYVSRARPFDEGLLLNPGDIVEITGQTVPGDFTPSINEAHINVVGHRDLPEAKSYHGDMQFSPLLDCEWMSLSARLVSMRVFPDQGYIMVELIRNNYILDIQMPYSIESVERLKKIMFEWIRVDVVAGTVYNSDRQATGRIFYASSADDFKRTISDETRARTGNTYPISQFMNADINHLWVVNSEGTVTSVGDREIFLRDQGSSVRVTVVDTDGLTAGDRVYIEGYVSPEPISPGFRAREHRILGREELPAPTLIDASAELETGYNYDLIEVDALVVDIVQSISPTGWAEVDFSGTVLLCRAGDRLFEARLPGGVELPPEVTIGATVRLTGICHIIRDPNIRWRLIISGFWLQLRTGGDLQVVAAAPWWTVSRMLWATGFAFAASTLFLAWVILLRRTVDRQTKVIGEKIERETILNERQRMARELHDNLDQGLTGAAVHLQASRKFLSTSGSNHESTIQTAIALAGDTNPSLKKALGEHLSNLQADTTKCLTSLQSVQSILTHCGEESRTSILELRGGLLEKMDLPAALQESLQPLADECGSELTITVKGSYRRLVKDAERHLLMVAREATTNAVRHGHPNTVSVQLEMDDDALSLTIKDDGCGFNEASRSRKGHFGIQGMKERVNRLRGRIAINTKPGHGTEIVVTIEPLKPWKLDGHK